METSIYLARFWGSLFILLGLGSVLVKFLGRVIAYTEDKTVTISTGYITFLLGLITVTLHSYWTFDLRIAITILGWVTLIKGIEKIVFPDRVHNMAQKFKSRQSLWGFSILLIGIFYFWLSLTLR